MAPRLPDELINEILSRVPAKSILRFRCVSKRWLALIGDSDFVKMHLNRSIEMDSINLNLVLVEKSTIHRRPFKIPSPTRMYLLDQDIKIQSPPLDLFYHSVVVGSCNGVVCLIKGFHVLLFNPITREYRIVEFDNYLENVPKICFKYQGTSNEDGVYGLGCDSDEYKLVQFLSHRSYVPRANYLTVDYQSKQNSKINVYSLNDSSCLTISDIPYCFANIDEWGIYLNGAIHWVAKRINTQYEKLIVSFDIREKLIRELPLPDVVDKTSCVTLGVLGGQLCVFLNFYLEIWVMKIYGLSSSWYKLASMDRNVFSSVFQEENHASSSKLPANFLSPPRSEYHMYSLLSAARVLCFSKSGEILLSCAKRLFLYNPKQNTSRHIVIPGVGEEYPEHKIITSVASYVPLNSDTYLPVEERGPVSKKRKALGGA